MKGDLFTLVLDEFKWILRGQIRAAELAVLRSSGHPRLASHRAVLADLAPLLNEPYRIGDGVARRFGELTLAEHETRIQMLRSNINGLQRDIEIHEQAIALIKKHRVVCLDEVGRKAVAA